MLGEAAGSCWFWGTLATRHREAVQCSREPNAREALWGSGSHPRKSTLEVVGKAPSRLQSLSSTLYWQNFMPQEKYLKGPNSFLQSRQWRMNLELWDNKWKTGKSSKTYNFISYNGGLLLGLTFKFGTLVRILLRTSFLPSIYRFSVRPERLFFLGRKGLGSSPVFAFLGFSLMSTCFWELQFLIYLDTLIWGTVVIPHPVTHSNLRAHSDLWVTFALELVLWIIALRMAFWRINKLKTVS